MNIKKFSVSQIKAASICPYKLYLQKKTGRFVVNGNILQGRAFHRSLEFYLREKANGRVVGYPGVMQAFNEEFAKGELEVENWDIPKGRVKQEGLACLENYYRYRCPVLIPGKWKDISLIEFPVFIDLRNGDQKLRISGKVDLITSSGIIVDHKKANRGWGIQKAMEEPQALLYPFILKNMGIEIKGFEFGVATKENFEPVPILYDEIRLQSILSFSFSLKQMFETEKIQANTSSKLCNSKYCIFFAKECEYGKE